MLNLEYLRKMKTVLKLCVGKKKRCMKWNFYEEIVGKRNLTELTKKMKMHSFYVFSSFPFLLEKLLGELKLLVLVV